MIVSRYRKHVPEGPSPAQSVTHDTRNKKEENHNIKDEVERKKVREDQHYDLMLVPSRDSTHA